MAGTDAIARLYDQLNPRERLALVLEARARGDETEEQRLRSTCPRRVYSMPDAAFTDREDMCFARMALALADLRGLMCELRGLHHVIDTLEDLSRPFEHAAMVSFLQGARYGRGEPPFPFDSVLQQDGNDTEMEDVDNGVDDEDDTDEPVPADDGEGESDRPTDDVPGDSLAEVKAELQRGMDASMKIVARATDTVRKFLVEKAEPVARTLLSLWEAMERFCRGHVGVEAMTLFNAWGMGDAMDITGIRERYSGLALDEALIVRCLGHIEDEWVERFGSR